MNNTSPILLVSDLDDTIKISHTTNKVRTIFRGLFRSSAYSGMSELYREILANENSRFVVVSSSPPAIRKKIEYFFKKNNFPKAEIHLRDWIRQTSTLKYKLKVILDQVEKSELPVILIGDDTERDPEVFAHVHKRFPEKVIARYLHVVAGRDLMGAVGYFTAFDLACAELSAGRLTSDQVLRIGEAVLATTKNSRLIPRFSLKPPLSFTPFVQVDTAIRDIWTKLQGKIESMPGRKSKR